MNESGLNNVFTFYGYQDKVGPFLSAADILVLTSDTEGLPGVVPEAGYFSTPSVAANVGGINECIVNGKSGYVIKKDDVAAFVNKINYLISNESFLSEMGRSAKELAINKFNLDNIAESYLTFFNFLLSN